MVLRRLLLFTGCLLLAINLPALAQTAAGLKGKVVDKDGQPLPTARVLLKNESLGVNQQSVADASGEFRIAPLPPGKGYTLEVSFTGMSTIKMDVEITAGRMGTTTVTLRPSSELKEEVKVTAKGDVVDTTSATTSTTISSEFIDALPILGRNYQDVLTLAPGVTDADGDGNPTIHGSRDTDVVTLVDGVSTNDPLTGKRGQELNIESIQEVELKTAGATAEYGRAQGGFVNIVTKSGGNEFEGQFSLYWRSNIFDGDGAGIDDPKLHGGLGEVGLRDLKFNDFDPYVSLGGPIKKDKAWYYFTAQYKQVEEPVNALTQAFVRPTHEKRVFGKVTWDMSTNHKLQFTATWDPQEYGNLGVDSFTAVESGFTAKAGGLNLLLKETAVFNPNVFLESTIQDFHTKPQAIPTLDSDTNHNGILSIDRNHNGFIDGNEYDPGEDWDQDGHFDVFEDLNHNNALDPGEDRDQDGRLTASRAACEGVNREDVDCDGHVDQFWEDYNNNHTLDNGEDRDGDHILDYIDEDRNHNGRLDPGEDTNENGQLDTFDPAFAAIHPYIEDRNFNQNLDDRPNPDPLDQIFGFSVDDAGHMTAVQNPANYPYGELVPIPGDRPWTWDQRTLRVSGPNPGFFPAFRGAYDFNADEGRVTLKEDLTVFVPDWHGQHDMKIGTSAERETYDQNTFQRPAYLPNRPSPVANTIQPRTSVVLPAENHVFNSANSLSMGMYMVDTYKPLPNLTLGMGMRFDREATDSFGYGPFDPVAQRNLFDRLNALGGGERGEPDDLIGNNDGIDSQGYCSDPIFNIVSGDGHTNLGNVCSTPVPYTGNGSVYDGVSQVESDLTNLKRVAGSRLTQHHTSTTIVAQNLATLFEGVTSQDPITGELFIDKEKLREKGAATFQDEESFRLTNNNFAPRLSLTWDPWADSKTKVFANWGRYYDRLFLDTVIGEEGPDQINRYYQKDADGVTGSGLPDNGIGNAISKSPPSATQVDRGLQTPFSDEFTVGFERELAPEISLKITYINKRYRDQLQDRDINHDLRYDKQGQPLDAIGQLLGGSGGSGASSNTRAEDGKPDLYIHNFFFNSIYFLTNNNQARYKGIEFQVTKRLSRKWQMDASYTYSRNVGFADSYNDVAGDDPATIPYTFGYQTDDQRHVVKFNAATYLPNDWQVSGTAQWASGLPYSVISFFQDLDNFDFQQTRFLYGYIPDRIQPGQTKRELVPVRRNSQRNDPVMVINLHADKAFVLGKLNSKLFLDVENVLNSDYLRIFTYEPAAPDRSGSLQTISERNFGRRFQVGFRFDF